MTQNNELNKTKMKKKRLATRTFAVMILMALFTLFTQTAQAQTPTQVLKMTNGTREVPSEGFLFYDSGGPLLFDPATDPENAQEYNWTTWYQHYEEYTLTLTVPSGNGVQIAFTKLLVNNDTLRFYEGNTVDPEHLIGEFCNNEYSTAFCSEENPFTVTSHGNMTVRFISDFHWRDEGWEAVIRQASAFVPQPPIAVMDNCDNLVTIIPNCIGDETNVIEYKIGSGSYTEYTPGAWIDLNSQTFPVTLTVKATVDGTASSEKTYTFSRKIEAPNTPIYTHNTSSNSVTTYFPVKPVGVNDTYYIRWTINSNSDGTNENPQLWAMEGHEFQQPNNTPTSVPAGTIDYTNAGLTLPFYVHIATRGTTCPNIFSNVVTIAVTELCVPMPTISFATDPDTHEGTTTLACAMEGVTIYYTTDGSEPTTSSATYSGTFTVTAGTTVKAIAVKTGFKTSDVASAIFVPGGESGDPQSGTYGSVVLLDDREDHSWSYYSDETSPIKSLNPADVKITYTGYGSNTMTSTNPAATGLTNTDFNANVTSDKVAVNVGTETENQFIYLKTLEKDQSTTNEYPYTMIPNPFQKRPTYTGSKGEEDNGDFAQASIHSEVKDRNGNVVAQSANGNETENIIGTDKPSKITRGENTLLTQNFDAMTSISTSYSATGWYAYNAGSGNNWTLNTTSTYAHSGSNSAQVQYNSSNAANCYLVSAPFTVSADMTELSVSLYEQTRQGTYSYNETFEVFFVKASDFNTAAGVASATHYNAIASASYNNTTYAQQSGSVTNSALAGESVRVVVHCTSIADQYYLFIDDITVTETTSGGGGGTTVWVETTTITPGEEYLIGFDDGNGNVYLAVNYAVNESNHYYSSVDYSYYGYTALAAIDNNGYVTGVSGYATDLQYCTWKFSTATGGTIQSGYQATYYLNTWSSISYPDLYPNNNTSNGTGWTYSSGKLYRTISSTDRYAIYTTANNNPHMCVTSTNPSSANVKLYSKQTLSVPCTVTALAGSNISTAYVNEGSTPSGTASSVNTTTGSTVTFLATVNSGNFAFSGWYNGSTFVSSDNPYTCTVTGDLTLTAQAVPTYTVTAAAGTGISTAFVHEGTSFSGTSTTATVAQGGSATFQATLTSGYVFDGWYDQSNNRVSANLTYTATNIQGNFTLTARGSATYSINITASGGTVTASPTSAVAGTTITLTLSANSGYQLGTLRVTNDATGEEITVNGTGNSRTFTMPASTVTVYATFYDPTAIYRGFYAWRVKSLSSGLTIQRANGDPVVVGGMINADEDIKFLTSNPDNNEVEFEALWAQAWVTTSTNTSGLVAAAGYERNFMVLSSNPGTTTTTQQWPTTTTNTTTDGNNLPIYRYSSDYQYSLTQQIYTPAQVGAAGTITQIAFYVGTFQNRSRTLKIYLSKTSSNTIDYDESEGKYYTTGVSSYDLVFEGTYNFNSTGWHTITLTTPFYYDGTSNLRLTVCDNTNQNHSTVFRTSSSGGTRAVYVAWDSATDPINYYYPADGTSTYNNQIRFVKTNSPVNGLTVPLTMTTYNPDGTGGSSSVTLSNAISCGADLKFENIKMNALPVIETNSHELVIGRGVTPATTNGLCAISVNGYSSNTNTTTDVAVKTRLESGNFGYVYLLNSTDEETHAITGTANVKVTLGSDYDRSTNTNGLLNTYDVTLSYGIRVTGSDSKYNTIVKSGTNGSFGSATYGRFYMGFDLIPTLTAHVDGTYNRKVTILGGVFTSDFAGGINGYMGPTTDPNKEAHYVRIHGGAFNGRVYMGGTRLPGYGNRHLIATGGTFSTFITGGCYGYDENSGITYGSSEIYFGGKANQTSALGMFGSGYGSTAVYGTSDEDSYYVTSTKVVMADQAQVAGSVYGGGNNGYALNGSDVYVLGGTIAGSVYGGSNQSKGAVINVTQKGGTVNGSIYGGSNAKGTISGLATVNVSGGTVTNVFGGGYGEDTQMAAGTKVNVSGGSINNNVYGGGEEGTVGTASTPANTNVSISGGTMKNVYGAGKGDAENDLTADINGQTLVNVSGGTMDNVYGGGEAGNVIGQTRGTLASSVTIQGGTINEDVFGGGKLGKTTGDVIVNVFGGNIEGNVYGGAFGRREEVFIAGTHTVNVTGGNMYGNVYGGSRNADDALSFDHTGYEMSAAVNHVNISGGHIYYNVFSSGYFGHAYGSVYTFIGHHAINNAPNAAPTANVGYNAAALLIDGTVYAGADFGNFDGEHFGEATIEGYSNVYIDGTDYNTTSTKPSDAGYMNIGGSVLGVGTSCYAGEMGHDLIFRNYGQPVENPAYGSKEAIIEPYTTATRNLLSIQFFDEAVIDNCHIHFIGLGRVNSLLSTEKYALYEIDSVLRVVNGSSLFIDYPVDQMKKLGSYTCSEVYAATPSYTVVGYADLGPNNGKDNKFRVNNGSYLNVKYLNAYGEHKDYGELEGFFYMMTEDENNTCAYARPKQSTDAGNIIPGEYNNPNDGGFLSYDATKNTYNISGGTVTSGGVQMPYENHTLTTKNGELYFRIWRYGGIFSYREGVFDAVASTTPGYSTADVVISLPAQHGTGSYFVIKTENGFPLIDYGTDVMTVNAGVYNSTDDTPASNGWMYYDAANHVFVEGQTESDVSSALTPLTDNPNVNFGLVAIPQGSLEGTYNGNTNINWLICNAASDADEALTTERWYNTDNVTNPSVLFRLTYNNELTNNAIWDPITIILEQYDTEGHLQDEITIALSVSVNTTINQDFGTDTYAMMNGQGTPADTYTAKVVLPGFIPYVNNEGDLSDWTFVSAVFTPADGFTAASWETGSGYVTSPYSNDKFSMQIVPSANYDNTVGWSSYDHTVRDLHTITNGTHLAYTDGRNPTAFDFTLRYDGRATCPESKRKLGDLVVTLHFTNLKTSTEPDHGKDLTITIAVYRRGQGANYYLDGVNGNNFFAGDRPDAAKKTLSGIFNRTDYTPGDNIFIVNTVTADGANALDWNGEEYGDVVLYRYPGGHALKIEDPLAEPSDYYADYSTIFNPDNKGFTGTLVKVKRGMAMHGIILDGSYGIVHASTPNPMLVPDASKYQDPTAPMIDIETNGVLNVYADSKLQWNYTNSNGGAVYNAGKMIIRGGSDINHNAVLANTYKGAGVYVKDGATIIVSDSITIDTNYIHYNDGSKAIVEKNSNVYLEGVNSVIQVGTSQQNDGILALENSARIGVTKAVWPDYSYNPIAYSDGGGSAYLGNIIPSDPDNAAVTDYLIYDDDLYYRLVTLNSTPGYEPSTDYLFWVGTWVTFVREQPTGYDPANIDTPEELAWAISVVNGLNGVSPAVPSQNFNITDDIDMNANIWVPMGTEAAPYTGTFNGNGHIIKGVKSSLNSNDMGMFANLNGTVENMVLNVSFTGGNSIHMGSVAAHMAGGTISNVETAGVITGTTTTETIGGIVAEKTSGTIHSSFAVNNITSGNATTHVGGLVGNNAGDLLNSYANARITGSGQIGGLVGKNNGRVENCYAVIDGMGIPAFAYENAETGSINYCYADNANGYVTNTITGATLTGHGTYSTTQNTHTYGYMYWDNTVSIEEGETNPFKVDTIKYDNNQINRWPGLLSTMEHWVDSINGNTSLFPSITFTKWLRPTTKYINGDLPVLCFPSDNCMITIDNEGRALRYGPFDGNSHSAYISRGTVEGGLGNQGFGQEPQESNDDTNNGVDNLLEEYEELSGHLFVYDNAINVERVPNEDLFVYINEDVVFKQASSAGEFINTQVGVSFDNSCGTAKDFFGNDLAYDWHMLSTPLANAPLGINYNGSAQNWWETGDNTQVTSVSNSYMPDGTGNDHHWDFYSFYEPEYHWINLKRNSSSHYHYDEPHDFIEYTNESIVVPGKGYMTAIDKDSYLCNTGTLNGPTNPVSVTLTKRSHEPGTEELGYNLLGNPYQAYLDVNGFLGRNNLSSYWVYIAESNNYIAGNADASSNPVLPSATLHPHQGFFVLASSDGQEVNFDYSTMALNNPDEHSYFRGGKVNYPLVNLFVTNDNGMKDLAVIEFNRPKTGGSKKMRTVNNANFELAAYNDGERYSILFTEEGVTRVPVTFITHEDGEFTMTWSTLHGQFTQLFLIDNNTGVRTDMLSNDHYTFNGSTGENAWRFYIEFRLIDEDDDDDAKSDDFFAWFDGNDWIINGKGQLQLMDVLGHVLQSQVINNEQTRLNLNNYAAGVYMLHLSNGKTSKSQKIVVR